MPTESAEQKKAREAKERKDATLAGLKKRSDEGEKEREIISGRGVENTIDAGGSGGQKNRNYQRPSLKIADTPASPPPTVPTKPTASPVPPPTTGQKQAVELNKPDPDPKPPTATQSKPKPYSEMSLAEKAAEARKKKEAGR